MAAPKHSDTPKTPDLKQRAAGLTGDLARAKAPRSAVAAPAVAPMPVATEHAEIADPFLGAVVVARAANSAIDAFSAQIADHKPDGWAQQESAMAAEQRRTRDLALAATPTTHAGRIALLDYLAELIDQHGYANGDPPDDESEVWRLGYQALSEALRAGLSAESRRLPRPAVGHDLSALSLNDLANLHMMASAVWTTSSMFINAPFSWDGKRRYRSPLGNIVEAEADRWAGLATAAAEEAKRRRPLDDGERNRRLEIATQHAMLGGGPIEDKALVAELATAWGV